MVLKIQVSSLRFLKTRTITNTVNALACEIESNHNKMIFFDVFLKIFDFIST